MDVSIVILTRSQPEILPKCVASCVGEIQAARLTGEIILVDNASTDGSPQRVAGLHPGVRLIRNQENLGFGAANNIGIRAASGRYVLILNDDAILLEDSLSRMLRVLESDPKIAAVGPKLLNPDGSLQKGFTNRRFPTFRTLICGFLGVNELFERAAWTRDLLTQGRDPEVGGETDYVAAACVLARRLCLEAIGLFDEGFYYWFEDSDLCYRLKAAGWLIVYAPHASVTHYGSASTNKFTQIEKSAISFSSKMRFFRKHWSPAKYAMLRLIMTLALLLQLPALALIQVYRRAAKAKRPDDSLRASISALRWLLLEGT